MLTQGVVMTCDIRIGDFNLLNWNTTIGHDAVVGSYNVINPASSISGYVQLADACLLGTGCRVLEGLTIASGVTIGAGAVVTRSIADPGVWLGVPARELPAP
jgi:acetyltransferase-like isoleucine patch superfamily enzyme